MSSRLTCVTGFWDPTTIGRDADQRSAAVYLRLFEDLQRSIPWPIVIWIDPAWTEAVQAIVARGAPAERRVVARAFDDLPRARDRLALERLRPFDHDDPGRNTLGVTVVTWAKPDLVVDAIDLDGPPSDRWAWIDFGLPHVADLGDVDWRAIAAFAPERVRLCSMRATAPSEIADLAQFYRANWGKIAAGFFTGSADAMRGLRAEFHVQLDRMWATGRRVHDEQILAVLQAQDPRAYDCWYADYTGLLVNYTGIRRDVPTILGNLGYCRYCQLWTTGIDIATRLVTAMREQRVLLTPAETARLLHEGFICAYYADPGLAGRLGQILALLYRHGKADFRRVIEGWQPLVEQNLRFAGIDLHKPAWTLAELLAQPDLAAWRVCL